MGGNGFMAVSATHAALRLAQGAGRLIRTSSDRGVVAFLDSRMVTARYSGFLQRSLPPFWPTTDRDLVLAALQRLNETAPDPVAVADPAPRGLGGAAARPGASTSGGARSSASPPPPEAARTAVTHGHALSEQDDEELRDGVDLGLSLAELAESLGLSDDIVATRLAGLGLAVAATPLF